MDKTVLLVLFVLLFRRVIGDDERTSYIQRIPSDRDVWDIIFTETNHSRHINHPTVHFTNDYYQHDRGDLSTEVRFGTR